MFLLALNTRNYQKQKEKSGEASPYFEKIYANGKIIAYKDSIMVFRGSNVVRMNYDEFIALSAMIKKARDFDDRLKKPLVVDNSRPFNDGVEY